MHFQVLGKRIKDARENARMTQEELAAAIGCTTQHVSALERGLKTPRLDTFVVIANTVGVSADVLLQDVLSYTADPIASEFSSAVASMPETLQKRILKAVRAFSEEDV